MTSWIRFEVKTEWLSVTYYTKLKPTNRAVIWTTNKNKNLCISGKITLKKQQITPQMSGIS